MRLYFPIAKVDAEQRMVWGYASTEARDEQGEIVTRAALEAALGDYLKFANIREMHQLSAVGVAKEAAIDERGLYLGAKIVDSQAWAKIAEGVYKGFSIGGRVTARDHGDRNTVTALVLSEISLVDRPANPEAVFDYWKASTAEGDIMSETRRPGRIEAGGVATLGQTAAGARLSLAAAGPAQPVQIWHCGDAGHRHLAKAEALKCMERDGAPAARKTGAAAGAAPDEAAAAPAGADYADPGYQADGRKRYPLDTEAHIRAAWGYIHQPDNAGKYTPAQRERIRSRIIAAWKERIDPAGPPAAHDATAAPRPALGKALADVGRLAGIILDLDWLRQTLALEAAREGNRSPQPSRLQVIIGELCDFLNALVAEETGELLGRPAVDYGTPAAASPGAVTMAAGGAGRLVDLLRKAGSREGHGVPWAKALAEERAEKAALLQTLADLVPRLDAIGKRVEDIARQPVPPKTIARGAVAIAKHEDQSAAGLDPAALAAAFAKMSQEDQTLALIKAAQLKPIRPLGHGGEPPPAAE